MTDDAAKKIDEATDDIDKAIEDLDRGKDISAQLEELSGKIEKVAKSGKDAYDQKILDKYAGGKSKDSYKKGTFEYKWAKKAGKAQNRSAMAIGFVFLIFAAACLLYIFSSVLPLPEEGLHTFETEKKQETTTTGTNDTTTEDVETLTIGYEVFIFVASPIVALFFIIPMGQASKGGMVVLHIFFGGGIVYLDLAEKELPVMGGLNYAWLFAGIAGLLSIALILTRPVAAKQLKATMKSDVQRIMHIDRLIKGTFHKHEKLARKAMAYYNQKKVFEAKNNWSNVKGLMGNKSDELKAADKLFKKLK